MRRDEVEMIAVKCRLELEALGVELRLVQDHAEIIKLIDQLDKRIGPASDPNRLLLTQSNSFCVFVFNGDSPVLGFAVRLDDLGAEDAQSFLPRSIETIFGVRVTEARHEVFAGKRWGRSAYFGDLKSSTSRGLSADGRKIIRLSTAYAHYRAFNDFNADTNYCFLRGSDVRNGVPYGFLKATPFVWETDRRIYSDGNPEWVMQLSQSDLPSMLASVSALLPKRVAVKNKPLLGISEVKSASGS